MSTNDKALIVNRNPCPSCPYRRDCPPGVWAPDEYRKLEQYDDRNAFLPLFLCHQSNGAEQKTACKGWLTVHSDSIAVRLAYFGKQVTAEQVMEEPDVKLYASGKQAARAGLRGVKRPTARARRMAASLLSKGKGKADSAPSASAAARKTGGTA